MLNKILNRAQKIVAAARTPRGKKIMYMICAGVLVCWVLYRFIMIGITGRQVVFNVARAAAVDGVPVEFVVAHAADGVVRTPVAVRGNVARVSGATASQLRSGMKIGGGEITSVSNNIDLDTGLYVVRMRGAADGLQFAEYRGHGFFVPAYAVRDGAVMVVNDGVAARRDVVVSRMDNDVAMISSGLNDGDMVILSNVPAGTRVRTNAN